MPHTNLGTLPAMGPILTTFRLRTVVIIHPKPPNHNPDLNPNHHNKSLRTEPLPNPQTRPTRDFGSSKSLTTTWSSFVPEVPGQRHFLLSGPLPTPIRSTPFRLRSPPPLGNFLKKFPSLHIRSNQRWPNPPPSPVVPRPADPSQPAVAPLRSMLRSFPRVSFFQNETPR